MPKATLPPSDDEDNVPFDDYVFEDSEDYADEMGLTDTLDHEILMHRDSHFGGLFPVMMDYYYREGKGVNPEFSLERIQFLSEEEEALGQNLASILLSGAEAEKVARAREAYKNLRDLYESSVEENQNAQLIADLILTEEEIPEQEIANIVDAGPTLVPALVDLMQSEGFADPLFPGYGLAPQLAAICLGRIGDSRAIIPLFELIGKENFFIEDELLSALKNIGNPSKSFLLKLLQSRPMTQDNERAALALTVFSDDPSVAVSAFQQLKDPAVLKKTSLAVYLILLCEELANTPYAREFKDLSKNPEIATDLREEIQAMTKNWKE